MFIEAEFAFNENGNDGFWRFQLRDRFGRWIKMFGLTSFDFRKPGDSKTYKAFGTFQGNRRRGFSVIRVGEGEELPPGDYEVDSRFVVGVKAMLKNKVPKKKTKQQEDYEKNNAATAFVLANVSELEVDDIVQQNNEDALFGRILAVDHSGEKSKITVEWSDGTKYDMELPKDQITKVWEGERDEDNQIPENDSVDAPNVEEQDAVEPIPLEDLLKAAEEAKARVDAVKAEINSVNAPKGGEKEAPNLPATMDGEEALATIRRAAAEVAAEDGRFPVARSAEDIEAGAKKQYAGVFDSLKEEYPDLVKEFKDFEDFWAYAKKNLAAGTTTRYADSVNDIPPLMRAANRIYARDVLGVDPDGLITFYRNSVNGHADIAKSAAGYASLDRNMAFNYNSDKGNDGANGRYSIKAKPGQVLGLLGYSDAADEHGVVIGPDVTAMPGRVERLGDLGWTPVNELMDPSLTARTNGGSQFRHFSTASTFEFPVLDANPFAAGEKDKWSDFYAANGLGQGAIPSKYDEIYGEGAFERDFPGSSGIPRYDIARDLFTEKDGQFALDPIKFDETFKGSNTDLQGRAGDGRDKALKFFDAIQQLSGQQFMVPRGSEAEPAAVDAPNEIEAPETEAVSGRRLSSADGGAEEFWKDENGVEHEASKLKANVAEQLVNAMREAGITDEQLEEFTRYVDADGGGALVHSFIDWEGKKNIGQIKIWNDHTRSFQPIDGVVALHLIESNSWDDAASYLRGKSKDGDYELTMEEVKSVLEEINATEHGNGKYYMYSELSAQKRSQIAVSTMVSDWASSSNDNHPRSLALQSLAEEVFGIENASKWDKLPTKTLSGIEEYIAKFGDVYRAYLRAQYDLTQKHFKDAGISEVTLFRGMGDLNAEDVKGLSQNAVSSTDIKSRPLSSWSTSIDTAYEFAIGTADGGDTVYSDEEYLWDMENHGDAAHPLLMRQVVPVENIFAMPFTGIGCYSEQEMVVFGGEARVDAITATGDNRMRTLMAEFDKNASATPEPEPEIVEAPDEIEAPEPGGDSGWDGLGGPTEGKGESELLDALVDGDFLDIDAIEDGDIDRNFDLDDLIEEQAKSVRYYKGAGFRAMNNFLRYGQEDMSDEQVDLLQVEMSNLDELIDTYGDVSAETTVFRGMFDMQKIAETDTTLVEMLESIRPGDIISDPGYTATTTNRSIAIREFGLGQGVFEDNTVSASQEQWRSTALFVIKLPEGSKALGLPLETNYGREAEVVLPRDAKLKINGIRRVAQVDADGEENGNYNYFVDAEYVTEPVDVEAEIVEAPDEVQAPEPADDGPKAKSSKRFEMYDLALKFKDLGIHPEAYQKLREAGDSFNEKPPSEWMSAKQADDLISEMQALLDDSPEQYRIPMEGTTEVVDHHGNKLAPGSLVTIYLNNDSGDGEGPITVYGTYTGHSQKSIVADDDSTAQVGDTVVVWIDDIPEAGVTHGYYALRGGDLNTDETTTDFGDFGDYSPELDSVASFKNLKIFQPSDFTKMTGAQRVAASMYQGVWYMALRNFINKRDSIDMSKAADVSGNFHSTSERVTKNFDLDNPDTLGVLSKMVEELDTAIERSPGFRPGVKIYRGIQNERDGSPWLDLDAIMRGDITEIYDPSFQSTSGDFKVAKGFAKGSVVFEITPSPELTGLRIFDMIDGVTENEILLPRNIVYTITGTRTEKTSVWRNGQNVEIDMPVLQVTAKIAGPELMEDWDPLTGLESPSDNEGPEKPKDLFAEPTDPAVIAKMKADKEAREARQAELDAEKEKRQQEIRDAEAKAKAEEEAKKKKKKVIPPGFKNWFPSLEQLLRYKQENDPVKGNTILSKFLAAAGFDGKPKVVSQAEFDAIEGESLFRAVSSREQVEHFKESDLQYAGVGSFGNGTYTSNKQETTVYYAGDFGNDPAELEARTMEMKLEPDAKVLNFEDASDMYEAIKKMCNEFIEQYIASGADPADVQEVEWKLHNNSDWTNVAIMLGYDAVRLGVPTNFGGQDKEYYTIILNRGKVIINGKS